MPGIFVYTYSLPPLSLLFTVYPSILGWTQHILDCLGSWKYDELVWHVTLILASSIAKGTVQKKMSRLIF